MGEIAARGLGTAPTHHVPKWGHVAGARCAGAHTGRTHFQVEFDARLRSSTRRSTAERADDSQARMGQSSLQAARKDERLISPHGVVETEQVEPSAVVHEFAIIRAGAVVGAHAVIHPHVVIEPGVVIGEGVEAFPGAYLGKEPKGQAPRLGR